MIAYYFPDINVRFIKLAQLYFHLSTHTLVMTVVFLKLLKEVTVPPAKTAVTWVSLVGA